jgi:hypothetical protein
METSTLLQENPREKNGQGAATRNAAHVAFGSNRESEIHADQGTRADGVFAIQGHPTDDPFVHPLKDIYYAEKRIVGALPHMIETTTSPRRGRSSATK